MRVGFLALHHESNTFINSPTTLADFQRHGIRTGSEVVEHYRGAHHEVAGFIDAIERAGAEIVPIFSARATPSGTITAEAADQLFDMMFTNLAQAGRFDGLFVSPHGAAVSENHRDFDGHWLSRVREHVGPDVPMVCTLDPHANVSQRMIDACNATLAYRTNPHVDQYQIGRKAGDILVRTIRREITPTQHLVHPRVSISIDQQETDAYPARHLYDLADPMLEEPGILANSVILGFPYADVAEMGSGFIVVADNNSDLARRKAGELGRYLYEHRHDYACNLSEVDDAVAEAQASSVRTLLLDVGDNVGGGGPGDGTILAHALHEKRVPDCFVCLYDPAAVEDARDAGQGGRLTLTMGGHTDDRHGRPLTAEVTVLALPDGKFTESEPRHGGRKGGDCGPSAVVRTDTGLTIMLITHRVGPYSLQQLIQNDIDPEQFHILTAKGVNAPLAAYKPVCPHYIRVNTPGSTGADATKFHFEHRPKPLFPFEEPPASTE